MIAAVRSGRISEERIDQSVRRLLREKFVLGLFDQPFLEVERAVTTIGRADFVAEGEAAQRAAIVRLTAADSGPAALPVAADQAVYVENIAPVTAARLGRLVDDPADADLAVLRINAPYEPRPGGFESFFHAGSLEFAPQECETDRRDLPAGADDRGALPRPSGRRARDRRRSCRPIGGVRSPRRRSRRRVARRSPRPRATAV